jgi:hypothetical protein
MTRPLKDLETCEFSDHETGNRACKRCETGYPRRCGCAEPGLIHAEIVKVKGNGFMQLTRCDKCARPG